MTPGSSYFAQVIAVAPTGYTSATSATSASSALATVQLNAPVITAVLPSTTTTGQITIAFTASSNAPGGQSYTAKACTDSLMSLNCVSHTGYTSGSQFTALTTGSNYFATISAVASTGYLAATTASSGPALATIQLTTPTGVTLNYGASAGSVNVVFTGSSNAPGGETYTVTACTNSGMSSGCVSNANLASGSDLTGLNFTQGSVGTNYFVTVQANATSGYLASAATATVSHAETSLIGTPSVTGGTTPNGAGGRITISYAGSSGTAPSSYTLLACTNTGMTTGCHTYATFVSGTTVTGLTSLATYYVTITAVAPTGYLNSTSAVAGPYQAS